MRTLPFLASASLCGHRPQAMLQGTLRNHQPRVFQPLTGERRAFAEFVIAKHGIVPAFDVQVGIVAGTQERVDDFRPVRLAQTGKAMLRNARMAEAINFEQLAVDVSVLRVDVKNSSTEPVMFATGSMNWQIKWLASHSMPRFSHRV